MFLLSSHCLRPALQSLIRSILLSTLEAFISTELLTGIKVAMIKALSLSKIFKGTSAQSRAKPHWRCQELCWGLQKKWQEDPSLFGFPLAGSLSFSAYVPWCLNFRGQKWSLAGIANFPFTGILLPDGVFPTMWNKDSHQIPQKYVLDDVVLGYTSI